MKKIRSSKKGFTLAELLIVVAIIGVLVGISIPIFTTQLEKSREATDIANLRAAKAAITAQYLDDATTGSWWYNTEAGKLVDAKFVCGEGTATTGNASNTQLGYNPATDVTAMGIKCTIATDGTITVAFAES